MYRFPEGLAVTNECNPGFMWRDDRGSGTVLGIGVMVTIVLALALLLTGGAALVSYRGAQYAVEQAALVASDAAVGSREGYPCSLAQAQAQTASAYVVSCQVRGTHARLIWRISVLGFPLDVKAQAGVDTSIELGPNN